MMDINFTPSESYHLFELLTSGDESSVAVACQIMEGAGLDKIEIGYVYEYIKDWIIDCARNLIDDNEWVAPESAFKGIGMVRVQKVTLNYW